MLWWTLHKCSPFLAFPAARPLQRRDHAAGPSVCFPLQSAATTTSWLPDGGSHRIHEGGHPSGLAEHQPTGRVGEREESSGAAQTHAQGCTFADEGCRVLRLSHSITAATDTSRRCATPMCA